MGEDRWSQAAKSRMVFPEITASASATHAVSHQTDLPLSDGGRDWDSMGFSPDLEDSIIEPSYAVAADWFSAAILVHEK